jgi:hypothetical protein
MTLEDPIAELSAALDEIYRLRGALAYEAEVLNQHLSYKTFPKSRRDIAERQIGRMQQSARGDADLAYGIISSGGHMREALKRTGASETLTRWEFADECSKVYRLQRDE